MAGARGDGTLAEQPLKDSGQPRSSGATLMGEPSTIAEHVYDTYGRGDLDACLRLFAPDCRVTFPGACHCRAPSRSARFSRRSSTRSPTAATTSGA